MSTLNSTKNSGSSSDIELVGAKYCGYILRDGRVYFPDFSVSEPIKMIAEKVFHVSGWIYRISGNTANFVVQNSQLVFDENPNTLSSITQ